MPPSPSLTTVREDFGPRGVKRAVERIREGARFDDGGGCTGQRDHRCQEEARREIAESSPKLVNNRGLGEAGIR